MGNAERTKKRLMKTSTFDALAMSEDKGIAEWDDEVLAAVLEDTAEVEKRRWIERGSWIVTVVVAAGFGILAGQYVHEETKPQPWVCEITLVGQTAEEPDKVRCTGGTGQVIE
jgi:hypothetical protein